MEYRLSLTTGISEFNFSRFMKRFLKGFTYKIFYNTINIKGGIKNVRRK